MKLILILCGGFISAVGAFTLRIQTREKSSRLHDGGPELELSAILANSGTLMSAFVSAHPVLKFNFERYLIDLPKCKSTILTLEEFYVARPSLEDMILKIYNSKFTYTDSGSYTILVGVKGSGKSYATAHVLNQRPGVLYVPISQAETPSSMGRKLLLKCGQVIDRNIEIDVNVLLPLFEEVKNKIRPVTVVFEVDRVTASEEVFYTVKKAAKKLATAANVIIVLSDATAGLAFGDDNRQDILWVDGMTEVNV